MKYIITVTVGVEIEQMSLLHCLYLFLLDFSYRAILLCAIVE